MRSLAGVEANSLQERHQPQPQPRFRIPQDLPPSISRHVVRVTEPEDIFTDFQNRRERNYHLLIRRFINQILYGCTNSMCTTPTCLSYQRRTTKTPLRRLTPLSARTLACYLASESNPEASLCPHRPQVIADHEPVPPVNKRSRRKSHVTFEPSEKEDQGTVVEKGDNDIMGEKTGRDGHPRGEKSIRSRPGVLLKPTCDPADFEDGRNLSCDKHTDERLGKSGAENDFDKKPVRDPKSFTQSLFETLPLRMLEWLPFQPRRGLDGRTSSGSHSRLSEDLSAAKKSRRLSADVEERFKTGPPVKVSQHPLEHIPSEAPAKIFEKDLRVLPNGNARRGSKDCQSPRHPTRSSSLKIGNRGPSLDAETLPTLLPFAVDNKGVPKREASSPPLSIELSREHGSGTISPDPNHRQINKGNEVRHQQEDDQPRDTHDSPTSDRQLSTDDNGMAATYAMEKIPMLTFGDLSLMQAKVEKQCLGYQLTDRRAWPDDSKPHESQAQRFADWNAFVKQCCFFLLKEPTRLARAFEWDSESAEIVSDNAWPVVIVPAKGFGIFGALYRLRPAEEILCFLSYALDHVFLSTLEMTRPFRNQPEFSQGQKRRLPLKKRPVDRNAPELSSKQAAFVCAVMLYAIGRFTAINHHCSWPGHVDLCWNLFCSLRSFGRIMPSDFVALLEEESEPPCHFAHLKCMTDIFENEMALNLVSKLAKAVSNRLTFSAVSKTQRKYHLLVKRQGLLELLMNYLVDSINRDSELGPNPRRLPLPSTTLEWLRTIILRDWNGKPIIHRAGTIGGALQMLAAMYERRTSLRLSVTAFQIPFFAERLDTMEMPVEWLSYRPDNVTFHLLSHSFLFQPSTLVTYFRALNFAKMSKSFETALITTRHVSQFAYSDFIQIASDVELLTTMRPAMATYLVLNVRRDRVLTDAMNQLWRRQKRELMRPLKVRMGMDEGEEGIDHGGVQQEFFRCLFAEALDPKYGMFTLDERTRMTWFQPCSAEPLYKFEMIGILFSIAVYNSITLPVTFPIAFYRKLLDLHVTKLSHIEDGWPDLTKGLGEMLEWSEGDVEDVFMRTYEFSFDTFGKRVDIDMQRISRDDPWPLAISEKETDQKIIPDKPLSEQDHEDPLDKSHSHERERNHSEIFPTLFPSTDSPNACSTTESISWAPLVTNFTRKQFVKDYIFWLTDKSIRAQYNAFARGFYTCLDRHALSIFTAESLQSVIEGSTHISVSELQSITKYEDGYTADTATIRDFWDVVGHFSDEQKRGLLEFVTASQRVPVNGLGSVVFVIQRSGFDDSRLPTSMTCFGRLLLPQYSSREVLQKKLEKAIENSMGFGVA